jgi:hypothetical protein
MQLQNSFPATAHNDFPSTVLPTTPKGCLEARKFPFDKSQTDTKDLFADPYLSCFYKAEREIQILHPKKEAKRTRNPCFAACDYLLGDKNKFNGRCKNALLSLSVFIFLLFRRVDL